MSEKLERLKNFVSSNPKNSFYDLLLKKKKPKTFYISIIIPVRSRIKFLRPNILSLKEAINKTSKKINITVVEHSCEEELRIEAKSLGLEYYHIKAKENEQFNKALCENIGVILNKNSNYYLFHDLDCLVFDDFINTLLNDIETKNAIAIQTFKNRRLLYLNEDMTNQLLNGKITLKNIDITKDYLEKGITKAPGGSLLIEKQTFFNIGGFDPELFFGHAPEDTFFWSKLECLTTIESSNNEILHMFHEKMEGKNDKFYEMMQHLDDFNSISKDEKLEYINLKKNIISKYDNM